MAARILSNRNTQNNDMATEIKDLDYSDLEGGLVRMFDRFKESGTLTGESEIDDFIRQDPNAALLGLLYDQRIRAEIAFRGAYRLHERLGHLDMRKIADMDPDQFRDVFMNPNPVHRFGFKMAEYTQKVAQIVADEYKGNAANMWNDGVDYGTIRKRIRKLPGFGAEKAEKLRYMLHYFGHVDATGFTGV